MTLATTNNTKIYVGDNSTTSFSFPYLFYAVSDLVVKVDDVTYTLNGAGATGYTVTGAENPAGGSVVFNTAPITDADVIIQRIVGYVQETDFENFDGNPADVTEKQFDLLAMQTQQLAESVSRAVTVPVGETAPNVVELLGEATTAADAAATTATTQAGIATTQAGIATTKASEAAASAAGVSLPSLGASDTVLQVNTGGSALEYGKVDTANIADDAVGFTQMLHKNRGSLITYLATGAPTEILVGTNGKFLTTDGTDVSWGDLPTNGGWVPITTTTVTTPVASVDFTSGIDGTYKRYALVFDNLVPVTDNVILWLRTGNGGSFDSGASDYGYSYDAIGTSTSNQHQTAVTHIQLLVSCGSDTGESQSGVIYINNPADSNNKTTFQFHVNGADDNSRAFAGIGGAIRNEAAAHDRVQLLYSSGNVESGTITLYGIKGA